MLLRRQNLFIGLSVRTAIFALVATIFFSAIAQAIYAYSKQEQVRLLLISISEHREYQGLALDTLGMGNLLVQILESGDSQYVTKLKVERNGYQTLERMFSPERDSRYVDLGFNQYRIRASHNDIKIEITVLDSIGTTAFKFFLGLLATVMILIALQLNFAWRQKAIQFEVLAERERIAKQISHDIRSPLGALNVAISNFDRSPSSALELIANAGKRIKEITDDLGRHNLSETHIIPIVDVLAGIVEVSEEHNARLFSPIKHSWNREISGSITVHREKLKRIISNLLSNAVESSPVDTIEIQARTNDTLTFLQICIVDSGKGMSPEILQKVGSEGFSHGKTSGTGLGLFDASRTIATWGGDLKIESKMGRGTTVTLSFPIQYG